ncbi:hypothetical protein CU633_11925 [Bacillus sp. V3-13]|uniref:hypothetical protein n=1 Tax=Bacillus sp. V3-13 TaxID=2053728 RepID=UPI000C78AF6B|nr:hypothetical protein [Bacillus sp. V3-13]PLR77245.1 hypothetical protein CU633_11925 [Bacillus sp. V3-13]
MEQRLCKYKKRRWKSKLKLTGLSLIFFGYIFTIFLGSLPGTFAWFSSSASSMGVIKNSTTSDLLLIKTGDVIYEKNCKLTSSISITNISAVKIPLTVELLTKNGGNHSSTIDLEPGATFTTNPQDADNLPNQCERAEIEYHILGFNGYIDEIVSIPVDQAKLLATIEKKEEKAENEQSNQQTEVPAPDESQENKQESEIPVPENTQEAEAPAPAENEDNGEPSEPVSGDNQENTAGTNNPESGGSVENSEPPPPPPPLAAEENSTNSTEAGNNTENSHDSNSQ